MKSQDEEYNERTFIENEEVDTDLLCSMGMPPVASGSTNCLTLPTAITFSHYHDHERLVKMGLNNNPFSYLFQRRKAKLASEGHIY